jgi:hypothetical protein
MPDPGGRVGLSPLGRFSSTVSWPTAFGGMRALFVLVGAASIVPVALFYLGTPPRPAAPASLGWESCARVLRRRAAGTLFALIGFEGLFPWGDVTYVGAVAVARFGLNPFQVGL